MDISIWLPAPQTSSVDRSRDPGRLRQTRIKLKTAVHVLEMAPHMGDHHVPDAELGSSVSRLKRPSSHGGSPPNPTCRPNTGDKLRSRVLHPLLGRSMTFPSRRGRTLHARTG